MSCRISRPALALSALLLAPLLVHAADSCKLKRLAVLPVTMDGLRPTIEAQINGTPALFTLDSGAFWSVLTPASAQQYNLRFDRGRLPGFYIRGVGGDAPVAVTTVQTFTVFGVPFKKVDFLVGGSEPGMGTIGVLGQNLLRIADAEYDLAQGSLTMYRPEDCKHTNLAYWVKPGEAYSELEIGVTTPAEPHIVGKVDLNGAKVRVIFDTGASTSIVSLRTAAVAGVKPGGPGVESAGYTIGFGSKAVPVWIATFPELKIGGETVRNARIRFGDLGTIDMLLGDDFFLSHHVYVANSQHKLYFTYSGGPVFALNRTAASKPAKAALVAAPAQSATDDGTSSTDAAPGSAKPDDAAIASSPTNASDLARRGAAFMARRDFDHALEDYNHAIELSPSEAGYYYGRALAELELRQPEAGGKDLDQALTLRPEFVDALVTRARYRSYQKDKEGALADVQAADHAASKEADVRLQLAMFYEGLDRPEQAVKQVDLWLPIHQQDPRAVAAYNSRCWSRAVMGKELDLALKDCDAALRSNPHMAQVLDSRGLVYLRRNQYDKAIIDYNEALKLNPKIAWSLYGRGIAELRKGKISEGQADISAAKALAPHLEERAQKIGVGP
jgi:tetratricopeptide (TPR) repeat protein/predicted aspartyl protease